MRTYDVKLIEPAVEFFIGKNHEVDLNDWINQPNNLVFTNLDGDLALVEKQGNWQVHCYFNSRGKKAIEAGNNFLDEIFNVCYNIKVLTGLTPIGNLRARWLAKKIGFKSQGVIDIDNQKFELFMVTKDRN